MARGSKAKYTAKQKRMAEHIEEGYEKRGASDETAEARAWATVNKLTGGGMKKGGSGSKAKVARSRPAARKNARKAGRKGGKATAAKRAGTRRATTATG
ncbi:transcriptional regulator, partial [Myxococcus sp. 1LA]